MIMRLKDHLLREQDQFFEGIQLYNFNKTILERVCFYLSPNFDSIIETNCSPLLYTVSHSFLYQ